MRRLAAIGLLAGLSGCIPPAPRATQTPPATAPHLDTHLATLFDEQPVWVEQPARPQLVNVIGRRYIVAPGDTLSAIGESTGAGADAIALANGLVVPFTVQAGQSLEIPAGRYHRVAAGESGIGIARAYGVRWSDLIARNGLSEPFILKIGQRLALPDHDPLAARAAAFRLDIDDLLTGAEPAGATVVAATRPTPQRPLKPTQSVAEPARFSGSFGWPAAGKVAERFGVAGKGQINQGIDIAVSPAAPVLATSDGVIAFLGDEIAGYGGVILIRHGAGWISAYGRVARATVTRGQSVKRGQTIGAAGSGSAPRLHFELRRNRIPVDPLKQLPPR